MNKKQVLAELVKNLEECSERGYVFHPKFMYEFQVLLKNATGNEKEIFTLLVKQLNFLKELGTNVCKADSNEIIKNQDRDYYSLHLSGKNFNFRLLMAFDEKDTPKFLVAFYERAGMMQNLNGTEGSVSIIGAVSPQGGDFSEPVTQNTKRFVRCFWGLDKSLAYARHFPAIHWLTSYSEYLEDLTPWYREHVSPKFVADRNQLMAILNQESSLMEIVKLIGSDVLPDDQKLTLEIARVIRLGFLQQNAFHAEDTCVPMEKQFKMMETILYLYEKCRALINRGMPVSVLKEGNNIFEKIISIKYDVANNQLDKFDQYKQDIDTFYDNIMEKNG